MKHHTNTSQHESLYYSTLYLQGKWISGTDTSGQSLTTYTCQFDNEGIHIMSEHSAQKIDMTIAYSNIEEIILLACSRLNGWNIFLNLSYDFDIIVKTKDGQVYHIETLPTADFKVVIDFIKDKEIPFYDQLGIGNILNKDDFIVNYDLYMKENFKKFADQYELDNPRVGYS